jgi:hypothetical protein
MNVFTVRSAARIAAVALVFAVSVGFAASAAAQTKGKSVRTEAEWVEFDPEAKTITAKVKKPGRGADAKKLLRRNKEATFAVKPEGSVLTRTTVSINGKKGELADIPAGKTVNIYWRPDETDPSIPRARKIDVILSDEELADRYDAADE